MANGYSLHLGLNSVDAAHYDGWDGPLSACEADAFSMEAICKAAGFEARTLVTADATRDGFLREAKRLASLAASGDIITISYSGHGGQLPDRNGDEKDRYDETWCLYDGQLVDDELYTLWSEFPTGTRIVLFSDSCHSGTVLRNTLSGVRVASPPSDSSGYRAMPPAVQRRTFAANRDFYENLLARPAPPRTPDATVALVSGCQDNQLSQDGVYNGAFTGALIEVWNDGRFRGDYEAFTKAIRKLLPPSQSPNFEVVGRQNDAFTQGQVLEIEKSAEKSGNTSCSS